MKRREQIDFVRNLSKGVINDIIEKILSGSIPSTWDGFELRQYLADRFNQTIYGFMGIARKKEYKNTIIAKNL